MDVQFLGDESVNFIFGVAVPAEISDSRAVVHVASTNGVKSMISNLLCSLLVLLVQLLLRSVVMTGVASLVLTLRSFIISRLPRSLVVSRGAGIFLALRSVVVRTAAVALLRVTTLILVSSTITLLGIASLRP